MMKLFDIKIDPNIYNKNIHKSVFSWHHGNIPRVDCQTLLEKAFLQSVKISGKPVNAWLVRLSRNNEQTISICFSKKKSEVKLSLVEKFV